jgi:hypothetical protein
LACVAPVRANDYQVRSPSLGLIDNGVFGRIYYDNRADRQKTSVAVAKPGHRALDGCLSPAMRSSLKVFSVARAIRPRRPLNFTAAGSKASDKPATPSAPFSELIA